MAMQQRRYIVRASRMSGPRRGRRGRRIGTASEWGVYDRKTRAYVAAGLSRDEAYAVRDKYEGGLAMRAATDRP